MAWKILLPQEGDEVVLFVGEHGDAIETAQERLELGELEPGVEAEPAHAVAVEEGKRGCRFDRRCP